MYRQLDALAHRTRQGALARLDLHYKERAFYDRVHCANRSWVDPGMLPVLGGANRSEHSQSQAVQGGFLCVAPIAAQGRFGRDTPVAVGANRAIAGGSRLPARLSRVGPRGALDFRLGACCAGVPAPVAEYSADSAGTKTRYVMEPHTRKRGMYRAWPHVGSPHGNGTPSGSRGAVGGRARQWARPPASSNRPERGAGNRRL